jgi:PEGA domain
MFQVGGNTMRRLVYIALLLGLFVAVAGLSAKDSQPKFKTAEVKHLTKADGVDLSHDYLDYAYEYLREDLQKTKLFSAVVEDGGSVADADAANSVIVACKFLDFSKGHFITPDSARVDITISRRSDHAVVQRFTTKLAWKPVGNDKGKGMMSGKELSYEIKKALGKSDMDAVAANPAPAVPVAPVAVAEPPKNPNVKLAILSTPEAADIEVDGSFVGNTPSAVELAPGEHTVVISKKGFWPWKRTIKLVAGDIKLNAELEKATSGQ